MNKISAMVAATLVSAALTASLAGAANAGPNCGSGPRYSSAPKASVIKQAQTSAPAKAKTQRLAQAPVAAPVAALGGGDGDANAPVPSKKVAQVAPKSETPAVVAAPQVAATQAPANAASGEEYTSVSGIAARLAALTAQQKSRDAAAQ